MNKIDYATLAKSRYTNQFEKDKVFDAIVQTLIEYKMKTQELYINFARTLLDIELSTGKNLDLIGSIVGQPRILVDFSIDKYFGFLGNPRAEPYDKGLWYSTFSAKGADSRTLSDVEYRRIIKARIIRNRTNCSRADFIRILDLILDIDRDKAIANMLNNSNFTQAQIVNPSNAVVNITDNPNYKVTNVATATGVFVRNNMIKNGKFENGLSDWTNRGSEGIFSVYDWVAYGAKWGRYTSQDTTTRFKGFSQSVTGVKPDKNYALYFTAHGNGESVGKTVNVTVHRVGSTSGNNNLDFTGYATPSAHATHIVQFNTNGITDLTSLNIIFHAPTGFAPDFFITEVVLYESVTDSAIFFNVGERDLAVEAGKDYTISFDASIRNRSPNYKDKVFVRLTYDDGTFQLIGSYTASNTKASPTKIVAPFKATKSSSRAFLSFYIMGIPDDWFELSNLQFLSGSYTSSNVPAWTPSVYDSPRYTLTSPSHGNIDLNVFNYTGDLGVHFLSNFEKTGDLIPVPMGYKLSILIN
ncbi:baseplate wedge protein [Acinetobacter phage vB_AbaM_P1]|nr:baseplate wedge protein [Acinetobacter phage vB_AbaM_P1]WAX22546.1 hypothetical protein [Acinetobacter phage vB_AbaP_HB01]